MALIDLLNFQWVSKIGQALANFFGKKISYTFRNKSLAASLISGPPVLLSTNDLSAAVLAVSGCLGSAVLHHSE